MEQLFKAPKIPTGLKAVRTCQGALADIAHAMTNAITAGREPAEAISQESLDRSYSAAVNAHGSSFVQCQRFCFAGAIGYCPFYQRPLEAKEMSKLLGSDPDEDNLVSMRMGSDLSVSTTSVLVKTNMVLGRGLVPRGNSVDSLHPDTRDFLSEHFSEACADLGLAHKKAA